MMYVSFHLVSSTDRLWRSRTLRVYNLLRLDEVYQLQSVTLLTMMKGYKVTDSQRQRKFGVACSSLEELEKKGVEKLGLKEKCVIALEDGTIVQDSEYFATLPPHTLFIFYKLQQHVFTGVDLILDTLNRVNDSVQGFSIEDRLRIRSVAEEVASLMQGRSAVDWAGTTNTAATDPAWFKGLETNSKTKEEYMFRKAQERIRGYYYKFQGDIKKSALYKEPQMRALLSDVLLDFKKRLNMDEYFGSYFDRRCAVPTDEIDSGPRTKKKQRLLRELPQRPLSYCDPIGVFLCQGLWKHASCSYSRDHSINPYSNRESRVVFSTWNLDHKIERSRTILPALLKAVATSEGRSVNVEYFYNLLFTRTNLKMVHIVCHDKTAHDITCDSALLHLPATKH